jgi:hypothetical protein
MKQSLTLNFMIVRFMRSSSTTSTRSPFSKGRCSAPGAAGGGAGAGGVYGGGIAEEAPPALPLLPMPPPPPPMSPPRPPPPLCGALCCCAPCCGAPCCCPPCCSAGAHANGSGICSYSVSSKKKREPGERSACHGDCTWNVEPVSCRSGGGKAVGRRLVAISPGWWNP